MRTAIRWSSAALKVLYGATWMYPLSKQSFFGSALSTAMSGDRERVAAAVSHVELSHRLAHHGLVLADVTLEGEPSFLEHGSSAVV